VNAERTPTPSAQEPLPQLLKLVTELGSLAALVTALLYYFGWTRSQAQARAFGADASVFAMSTQDFVLRSMDVVFIPILLVLLASLLGVWLHQRITSPSTGVPPAAQAGPAAPRQLRIRRLAAALRLSWLIPVVVGIPWLIVSPATGRATFPLWFALGVLGTWYGSVLRRIGAAQRSSAPFSVLVLILALMAVTLFWMTERFASFVGQVRVDAIKANVAGQLEPVTVYSAKRLNLDGPGVVEVSLGDAEAAYLYRYDGLYLLQRSGGKYFLLTGGWDVQKGRLVVLADDNSIRLQFGSTR